MKQAIREMLGKAIRDEWVMCASEEPDPKPSHLVPWQDLNERDKEIDRRIGQAAVKAYCERPEYATMRHEAIQTIYALVKAQNGIASPEAILHLGMFMAMSGGHDET